MKDEDDDEITQNFCNADVLSNTIGYPKKGQHLRKNIFGGGEMVALRSPDLWGVQSDAEFYARFAHEGPEAARTHFKG